MNKSGTAASSNTEKKICCTLFFYQHACGAFDVDIIAMDPVNRPSYVLSRKLYNMAVERNIFFELTYGSAMSGTAPRKLLFSTGHNFHVVGKCKVRTSFDTVGLNLLKANVIS